jgi:hypothetical protein
LLGSLNPMALINISGVLRLQVGEGGEISVTVRGALAT